MFLTEEVLSSDKSISSKLLEAENKQLISSTAEVSIFLNIIFFNWDLENILLILFFPGLKLTKVISSFSYLWNIFSYELSSLLNVTTIS